MNELTTMVMVENEKTGEVVVIDRLKKYPGICFPGGHVEQGESFTACAVREVREETGLEIREPVLCGIINWAKKDSPDRYVEYLFRAADFSGELTEGTDEGRVFWVRKDRIAGMKLSLHFDFYLSAFFSERPVELFGEWTDGFDSPPEKQ